MGAQWGEIRMCRPPAMTETTPHKMSQALYGMIPPMANNYKTPAGALRASMYIF